MLALSVPRAMTLAARRGTPCIPGSGSGQAGDCLLERVGRKAAALGQWFVIKVAVAAVEQHDVAGPSGRCCFSQAITRSFLIRAALARRRAVAQVAAVDHAGFAAELPGGNDVGVSAAELAGVRETPTRAG